MAPDSPTEALGRLQGLRLQRRVRVQHARGRVERRQRLLVLVTSGPSGAGLAFVVDVLQVRVLVDPVHGTSKSM